MKPIRLITSTEVGRMLRVTPSAVTNWRKRGTGPLPDPQYVYRTAAGHMAPLWTVDEIAAVLEEAISATAAAVDDLRGDTSL